MGLRINPAVKWHKFNNSFTAKKPSTDYINIFWPPTANEGSNKTTLTGLNTKQDWPDK